MIRVMTRVILRIEGLFIFLLSVSAFIRLDGNWLLFILLLILPDLSMLGYLKDSRTGAYIYNSVHNFVLALLVTAVGYFLNFQLLLFAGIVLSAHIGLDRAFGFGLKEIKGFTQTHLGEIQRRRRPHR